MPNVPPLPVRCLLPVACCLLPVRRFSRSRRRVARPRGVPSTVLRLALIALLLACSSSPPKQIAPPVEQSTELPAEATASASHAPADARPATRPPPDAPPDAPV